MNEMSEMAGRRRRKGKSREGTGRKVVCGVISLALERVRGNEDRERREIQKDCQADASFSGQ